MWVSLWWVGVGVGEFVLCVWWGRVGMAGNGLVGVARCVAEFVLCVWWRWLGI